MMLNLAIVGLLYWGRWLVVSAQASNHFGLVPTVDTQADDAGVKEFAQKNGMSLSSSYEDALDDPSIDAVVLVTHHNLHPEQVIADAGAGKNVYTEKPFALNKSLAERAVAACKDAGVVVPLGHDQRFYPVIMEMKRLINDGELGTFLYNEAIV